MKKKQEKKEKITFGQVIQALQNPSLPVPPKYMYKLSDVSAGDLTALKTAWPKIPTERRVAVMEDALSFFESDEAMDFSEIGLLAIDDSNSQVRELGIRLLAPYEMEDMVAKFISMSATDPETTVRAVAAAALGVFVYLGEIEEIDEATLNTVEEALLKGCAEGQPDLVRRRSLEALSYSSLEEVQTMIKSAYASSETDWVVTALNAMSRNLDEIWNPIVLASLKDLRPAVRAEAAHAAGEMELGESLETLLEMIRDDNAEAQAAAIWSVSQIGGEGAGEALEELLEETEDDDVAELIEEALDNLEFTEGVSAFELMELDDDADDDEPFDEDKFLSNFRPNGRKPN